MKKYVYHLVLLLFPFYNTSMAQSPASDAVYLKNGSIYWGTLVEQHKDSLVKIQIAGGSIIAVPHKELDHIERGAQQSATPQSPDDTKSFSSTKGYFNITEIGVMPGVTYNYYSYSGDASVGFTIQTINGYRFNSHFLIGGGLGLDIIQVPSVQFFADGRWEILKKRSTPFVYLDAGYGMPLAEKQDQVEQEINYKGGFSWGTGIGMRFRFRGDGGFLVSAGYKLNQHSEHIVTTWWPYDTTYEYSYNRLTIKLGVIF